MIDDKVKQYILECIRDLEKWRGIIVKDQNVIANDLKQHLNNFYEFNFPEDKQLAINTIEADIAAGRASVNYLSNQNDNWSKNAHNDIVRLIVFVTEVQNAVRNIE